MIPRRTWLGALLAALACGSPAPNPAGTAEETSEEVAEEMTAKEAVKMPTGRRIDPIDWVGAFQRQRIDVASLPAPAQQAIAASNVPVLLPSDAQLLATAEVYGAAGWYAATLMGDGYQVLVRGTRIAHTVALTEQEKKAMGPEDQVQVTRTEGIVTCSFSLFGAAYNLELECDAGEENPLCTTNDAAVAMAAGLGFAGGSE